MNAPSSNIAAAFSKASGIVLDDEGKLERLSSALLHALLQARAHYPGVLVDQETYASYLGERMRETSGDAPAVASRASNDLYLACACLSGDSVAISLLESEVLSVLPTAMARLSIGSGAAEEAIARTRNKLLVGADGHGKLRDFSGTGDLRGWVKVIAIRDALRAARKTKREVSLSDELAASLPSSALDPELAYQKTLYRSEFKASFEAAVDQLDARQRSLLRQAIVYRANVDQVATLYQVHRATAARWLSKAREHLAEKTRANLRLRLRISDDQFQSIVRLIESQMDLSMDRLLATAADDDDVDSQS